MTRDEIMALEGRELDAAVAEHVMGISKDLISIDGPFVHQWNGQVFRVAEVPHYSTDIAAAWQVVETDLWFDRYCVARCGSGYGLWRIASNGTLFKFEPEVYADTFPEAICRAALLAVLGEGE